MKIRLKKWAANISFIILVIISIPIYCQEKDTADESDLGQKAQNPLANLTIIPFQNNISFNNTQNKSTGYLLNIQPVFPLKVGKLSIINRTTFGFGYVPGITAGGSSIPQGGQDNGRIDGTWGALDLNWTGYFTPKSIGDIHWGFGPSVTLPLASDNRLGSGKWSVGPSLVFVWQPSKWTIDVIFRQLWSFAGNNERPDVNQFYLQPLVAYNLHKGWALATMPVITANWDKIDGEKWLVPLGGGFNKIFKINKTPVLLMCHYYHHIAKPVLAPSSELRVQLSFILAK